MKYTLTNDPHKFNINFKTMLSWLLVLAVIFAVFVLVEMPETIIGGLE